MTNLDNKGMDVQDTKVIKTTYSLLSTIELVVFMIVTISLLISSIVLAISLESFIVFIIGVVIVALICLLFTITMNLLTVQFGMFYDMRRVRMILEENQPTIDRQRTQTDANNIATTPTNAMPDHSADCDWLCECGTHNKSYYISCCLCGKSKSKVAEPNNNTRNTTTLNKQSFKTWECTCGIRNNDSAMFCSCGKSKPQSSKEYVQKNNKTYEQSILSSGGWKCDCGNVNAAYVSSCGCGKSKSEILASRK